MRQGKTTSTVGARKPSVYTILITAMIALIALINLIAWNFRSVADWYRDNVFVLWGPLYGHFTSFTDYSVGEFMLGIALLLLITAIVAIILLFFKKPRRFAIRYLKVFALILCIVGLIQTLNCFVLYHASTFEDKYVSAYLKDKGDRKYTIDELAGLRDLVVTRANELALKMSRDEAGNIIYDGDMAAVAVESMKNLGEKYSGLSGYYTRPKALYTSEFFSQQYMMGYYFPFSMEANYNDVMYISNIPHTMCHELSHTKGFISEDEANLIGFLACINSDDEFFRYSGYLSVLGYLDNDLKESIMVDEAKAFGLDVSDRDEITSESLAAAGVDIEGYTRAIHELYDAHPAISDEVRYDRVFLTKEAWNKVEEKAVLDTETVRAASDAFVNANLKANGVSQGDAIYSEVVALLMDFYVYNIEEELQ